jgi:hypothetical protein
MPKTKNNNSKISPPVADVVLADDFVALEFEESADTIADDCAAQVTYVHMFCDVRA